MFIGSAERSALKPECISPEMARQCARAFASAGNSRACGLISFKYSPIASVFHTLMPLCISDGTSSSISAFMSGSSGGTIFSVKSSPDNFASNQPRNAHAP